MSFVAVAIAGVGVTTAVVGGVEAAKSRKAMEKLQVPHYAPNQAISDYYQDALQRYNTSPYQSNFYEQAQRMAGRNEATAIGATMDRHSAGNVGAIVQGADDQMSKAGVQAEGLQRQNFSQLGTAANMDTADYQKQFEANQQAPFEKQLGIDQAKAVAGTQLENSGIQTASSGLGTYAQMSMFKNMGGNKGGGQVGGSQSMINGVPQFSGNNTMFGNPGGLGYQQGSNTDVLMNTNAFSNLGFPQQ